MNDLFGERRRLVSTVEQDEFTDAAAKAYDVQFTGTTTFDAWPKPQGIPEAFHVGVIVGASGSGKSTLARDFGEIKQSTWWPQKAIVSHFATPEDAIDKLSAVGLNSIPAWLRPYHTLSTGEKFRADTARAIETGAVIDEFTSVVDRNVAKACSMSLAKYLRRREPSNVVLVTCHRDILEWLEPDWVFDTDEGRLSVGRSLRRPTIEIDLLPADSESWGMFATHHYLTANIVKGARCVVALWNDVIVAFSSSISYPTGSIAIRNAWREHRLVVLPDFQGMGIGPRLSDAWAQIHVEEGKRYYSRTSHPRLGAYRDASSLWIKSGGYMKTTYKAKKPSWTYAMRESYAHEYVGSQETRDRYASKCEIVSEKKRAALKLF